MATRTNPRLPLTPLPGGGEASPMKFPASIPMRRPRVRALRALLLLLVLLPVSGCGEGGDGRVEPQGSALTEDEFLEVWVTLRSAARRAPDGMLDPATRDRLLQERGLRPEDLVAFVRATGEDSEAMARIWERAEEALRTSGTTP